MTNDVASALARIDRALSRIEAAAARSAGRRDSELRAAAQAALAQLDRVIERIDSEGVR